MSKQSTVFRVNVHIYTYFQYDIDQIQVSFRLRIWSSKVRLSPLHSHSKHHRPHLESVLNLLVSGESKAVLHLV